MATGNILFNPLAGNGRGKEEAQLLEILLPEPVRFYDITKITNYPAFIRGMEKDDFIVIAGGDGTLNRFVNDTAGITISQEILYFPVGTGNDFAHDLGKDVPSNPFPVTRYLQELPEVEISGKRYRFINGVGCGVDSYCCQMEDRHQAVCGKKVNCRAIAVKGLLRCFEPRNACVTVDGESHTYQKVWMAPTLYGRFYGGGMVAAPAQNRLGEEGTLSLVLVHGAGRLKTLCVFPGIFKGRHIKNEKLVAVHTGHEITVEFDRPTPLRIDGETVMKVSRYTARSAKHAAPRSGKAVAYG